MRFNVPVLCREGSQTSDGRLFDSWEWRALPLTLYGQFENAMGHDEAPIVGHIETISRGEGGAITGVIDTNDNTPDGQRAAQSIMDGDLRGISVDFTWNDADLSFECVEFDEATGWCNVEIIHWALATITASTLVGIPAFEDALVDPTPLGPAMPEGGDPAMAAGGGRRVEGSTRLMPAYPHRPLAISAAALPEGGALVASAADSLLLAPPAEWFEDPHLTEYTPLQITDEGRVFGHIAPWNGCHIGFTDRCVPPPRSLNNYADFRTGRRQVRNADGTLSEIRVGVLTVGNDHAPTDGPGSSLAEARRHYADASCGWATAAAGEDRFGPWVAGACLPTVTDVQLVTLRALACSGDWRPTGRNRELINVHMVNTPGFRDSSPLAAGAAYVSATEAATIIVTPALTASAGEGDCGCGGLGLEPEDLAILRALGPQARESLRARLRAGVG